MPKNNRDYDTVFKTLKSCHKRLFISVINRTFNKNYPLTTEPTVLPTDNYVGNPDTGEIEERESDLFFDICGDTYLIECQSYNDNTMAIRIAEYTFLSARSNAEWIEGKVVFNMPEYAVIYVKSDDKTPLYTEITFNFPHNKPVIYNRKNVILKEISKEQIIENKLIPYIPFYITRYEKEMLDNGDISLAISDLEYFKENLFKLHKNNELSAEELLDVMSYINRIIKHITNGNEYEERMVKVMGGTVEETPSNEIKRLENEKIALKLFDKGVTFEVVRAAISSEYVDDDKLEELMQLAAEGVKV